MRCFVPLNVILPGNDVELALNGNMEEEMNAVLPEKPVPAFSWKRLGWLVIEIVLFVVVLFVVAGLLWGIAGFLQGLSGAGGVEELDMWTGEAGMAIGAVAALYAVCWISRRVLPDVKVQAGYAIREHVRELLAGVGVAVALYGVGFLWLLLAGGVSVAGVNSFSPSLLQTWVFFFFVALFEETACRGFLLGRMMDAGVNKFAALFLSSAVFSCLHLANPNFAAVPFVNLLLAGVLLGSAYIYTRNLWFAIMLHWFWNWLQGPVLGFEVSGNRIGDSLLTLQTPDAPLLNGGPFGFEGSLVCTVLMVAGIFLVMRYYERRGRKW